MSGGICPPSSPLACFMTAGGQHVEVGGPWLTVRLPSSTRIRLTLTLALRTRNPSYAPPFDGDLPGSR